MIKITKSSLVNLPDVCWYGWWSPCYSWWL